MHVAAQAVSPGNPALAQFVLSVASALTVLVLTYIARLMRKFQREHDWLMRTTQKNTDAIALLMKERPNRRMRGT